MNDGRTITVIPEGVPIFDGRVVEDANLGRAIVDSLRKEIVRLDKLVMEIEKALSQKA
jgi:hypothetical protein